ncbi:MAG: type II secretion system F family protein, partial [Caldisericaceae bacterium]
GRVFPPIYVSLLSVGEATGALDKVLKGIASYLERDLEIRRKISSAFAYPKFVVTVVLGVVIFLLTAILPRFVSMYSQTGEALPTPTVIVLQISDFIRFKWMFIVGAMVILYSAYRIYYSTRNGRIVIDKYKLVIPTFGRISKLASLSRFLHSFALISASGINIIDTISIAANVTGNAYIIQQLTKVNELIKQGHSTAEAMRESEAFPKLMVQMFAIGERSGSVDSMANKLGELWDRDLDNTINNLAAKIEPTLIVVLGVIVGFIAVAMYLPMFSMPALFKKTL